MSCLPITSILPSLSFHTIPTQDVTNPVSIPSCSHLHLLSLQVQLLRFPVD